MKDFYVSFPVVSGYQKYSVQADNEKDAIEQVLSGNVQEIFDIENVEVDFDKNLAIVEEG